MDRRRKPPPGPKVTVAGAVVRLVCKLAGWLILLALFWAIMPYLLVFLALPALGVFVLGITRAAFGGRGRDE